MPTARRCQGCGATLGEPAAGATVVTCQFCGLAHDATVAFHSGSIVIEPQRVRRANRIIIGVVLLVVAIIVISALVPAYLCLLYTSPSPRD